MNGMTGGAGRHSRHLRRQIAGRLRVLLAVLVLAGCSVVERPASHRLRDEIARIRAAASLISSLRMLRVFETEPGLITHLVRLFEWAQPCADLPAVLGAGALSETSLGDLDEALKLAEAPDLLKRTIEGERVREMTFLASILGPDWPDVELRSASAKPRPFCDRRRP